MPRLTSMIDGEFFVGDDAPDPAEYAPDERPLFEVVGSFVYDPETDPF